MHRQSEKYVVKGSKYAHWIGLYLSSHLNWVLGPFAHDRLQNLQTSEVTFAHVITPLKYTFALWLHVSPTIVVRGAYRRRVVELLVSPELSLLIVTYDHTPRNSETFTFLLICEE